MTAILVPAPPELYQAVAKIQLADKKIREIIRQDMISDGKSAAIDITILEIKKVAVPTSPYVIWKARVKSRRPRDVWNYSIDAITGEILTKRNALIE